MSRILIKQVLHRNSITDILIEHGQFTRIEPSIEVQADHIIHAERKMAILPPFYNLHTHAAMTLLRGYADDLPLFTWLNDYIWPMEDKLTPEDIYWGSKLAMLEMIKSGTVFFNDMYWFEEKTMQAIEEMGLKAAIGVTFMSNMEAKKQRALFDKLDYYSQQGNRPRNVTVTIAPHAIYTVDETLFRTCIRHADKKNLILHTHLSETEQEVSDCLKLHGMRPVEWIGHMHGLSERLVAAHAIHVSPEEAELLAKHKVTLVHNPISNMKLASGVLHTPQLLQSHCRIALGTDGCSSNNNLDMREEMKIAALLAKCQYGQPELLPAEQLYEMSNKVSSDTFNLNSGTIEIGKQADALLIDLENERMIPNYNLISNWLYSAESSIIDTVLCDGRILMEHRHVPGEEQIKEEAVRCAHRLKTRTT